MRKKTYPSEGTRVVVRLLYTENRVGNIGKDFTSRVANKQFHASRPIYGRELDRIIINIAQLLIPAIIRYTF